MEYKDSFIGVGVHTWRLLLDRLPTRVNLVKRDMQLINMLCSLCQEGEETSQHLFGTCKVAQKVWDQCDIWVGNVTVRHEFTIIHFMSFLIIGLRQCANNAWKGMWVAIVLEIWNHKIKVVFNRGIVDAVEIFSLAQLKGWLWIKHKLSKITFSYSDWHFSLIKCLESLNQFIYLE